MTPPEAPVQGQDGRGAEKPPAVSVCLTLTKRADFLRAAQARRQGTPGFLLQARERRAGETDPQVIRVGYTCSKKLGNAVARNRAKRRLRAIARAVLPGHGRPGWDYVLVGRPQATATHDFAAMTADLARALARVHTGK
ncbi:MAG TPA: ribonuclease P protein component [Albidovulum sp.]|uniref:ribonuclease P protein component n=1 Tax=Albidovulum sp. TaxID=1872424 RepID=UPI002B61C1E4|nr:ribonuclease P protein component [Albidovulum sp.]